MSWSSVKRLTNEMETFESDSNKFVDPECYFIIRVHLEGNNDDSLKSFAKNILCVPPQPVAVYYCLDEVVLIFSCLIESHTHQFDGDHQRIISKYATLFARANANVENVNVKLVEFQTQTQVITYMGYVVRQLSQRTMKNLSNGKITDNLLNFRTEEELLEILTSEGVRWDELDSSKKYGTFIRLRRKHDKIVTAKISESFDARETKRYVNFIFGT